MVYNEYGLFNVDFVVIVWEDERDGATIPGLPFRSFYPARNQSDNCQCTSQPSSQEAGANLSLGLCLWDYFIRTRCAVGICLGALGIHEMLERY